MEDNDFPDQLSPTDISSLDKLIISTIPFSTVDQVYHEANKDNLDDPQFTHSFIENQINSLLFTPVSSSIFDSSSFSFINSPLSTEEDFMILLLSKFQKELSASSLCQKYRYLFSFNHPFSSLVSHIEQNLSCNFVKQSSIVEAYATTFAQLERIYDISEFTQDELENAQITPEDMDFISNSNDYIDDKSIIDYKAQSDVVDSTFPIEEIESNLLSLTPMNMKVFAFLETRDMSIPIMVKNFLIGDSNLCADVDFDLKSMVEYKPPEGESVLALIMLKNDINFYIENVGTSIIIIDGFQIWPGETTNLNHYNVFEMCGCDFAFSINIFFMDKFKKVALQISNMLKYSNQESVSKDETKENENE